MTGMGIGGGKGMVNEKLRFSPGMLGNAGNFGKGIGGMGSAGGNGIANEKLRLSPGIEGSAGSFGNGIGGIGSDGGNGIPGMVKLQRLTASSS